MAVLGITKLIAVNRMLRSINTTRVAALDTGGTSIQAFAEDVLDEITTQALVRGGDELWVPGKVLTPSAGSITLDSQVLAVRGSGKDIHRAFSIRGDKLWDMAANLDAGVAAVTVMVDLVYATDFVDLPPKIKESIVNEACQVFQRRYKGSPQADAWLGEELNRTQSASAAPSTPTKINPAVNPVSVSMIPTPQR